MDIWKNLESYEDKIRRETKDSNADEVALLMKSFSHLGLGFTLNAGFIQLFAVSDNIIGLIYPQSAKYTNARLGLNLTFGRKSLYKKSSPQRD